MIGLILTAAFLLFLLPHQFKLRPLRKRELILFPVIAFAVGGLLWAWERPPFSAEQALYFGLQAAIAVGAGVLRGSLTQIVPRGPFAWRRGGWPLALAWGVTLSARFAMDLAVHFGGWDTGALNTSFPLFFGITVSVQNIILYARVRHAGLGLAGGKGSRARHTGGSAGP